MQWRWIIRPLANSILTVKALEKTTGKEQSIRIEGSTGLSEADIEKMKQDAEVHAEEDKKRRELIDTRNMADQMIYAAEKAIKENGEKAGADIVAEVQSALEEVKKVKEGDDHTALKNATEKLSLSMQKIGEAMMKNKEAEGATPEAPKTDGDAPASDAEFKEQS